VDHEGRRNRPRRFYASGQPIRYGLPCLIVHISRWHEPTRTRGTANRDRTSIARSNYARLADYGGGLRQSRSSASAALGDVHVCR
jgi:hypothetical protein